MKKLFVFAAALMMGTSMFASLNNPPSDQTLQSYAEAGQNLVYAIFVEDSIKCNDIVLVGTYNNWAKGEGEKEDAANCSTFVAVDGYAGWYVCCVTDASESIEAKPVQLDGSGAFNWDYQVGKLMQEAVISGVATIEAGYSDECNIKAISDAQPLKINVSSWKTNPCTAKFHDYVITLVSPDCNELEYITPAISGGFNSWAQDSMTFDNAATYQRQQDKLPGAVYKYTAHAAEGTQFKFRSAESWGKDWTNELRQLNTETSEWEAFNGGQNFTFAETTELVYDLGDPTLYSWTNCERPKECDSMDYTIIVTVPACENSVPQLVGNFASSDWSIPAPMTATQNPNQYTVTVRALCTSEFKFNDATLGWDNEIKQWNGTDWSNGISNISFGEEAEITLDYSDTNTYNWTACVPTAVENVEAVKAIKKQVVNGQMVIIREDGKKFNVLGAEVK